MTIESGQLQRSSSDNWLARSAVAGPLVGATAVAAVFFITATHQGIIDAQATPQGLLWPQDYVDAVYAYGIRMGIAWAGIMSVFGVVVGAAAPLAIPWVARLMRTSPGAGQEAYRLSYGAWVILMSVCCTVFIALLRALDYWDYRDLLATFGGLAATCYRKNNQAILPCLNADFGSESMACFLLIAVAGATKGVSRAVSKWFSGPSPAPNTPSLTRACLLGALAGLLVSSGYLVVMAVYTAHGDAASETVPGFPIVMFKLDLGGEITADLRTHRIVDVSLPKYAAVLTLLGLAGWAVCFSQIPTVRTKRVRAVFWLAISQLVWTSYTLTLVALFDHSEEPDWAPLSVVYLGYAAIGFMTGRMSAKRWGSFACALLCPSLYWCATHVPSTLPSDPGSPGAVLMVRAAFDQTLSWLLVGTCMGLGLWVTEHALAGTVTLKDRPTSTTRPRQGRSWVWWTFTCLYVIAWTLWALGSAVYYSEDSEGKLSGVRMLWMVTVAPAILYFLLWGSAAIAVVMVRSLVMAVSSTFRLLRR